MKKYRRLIAALLCTALVFGIIPERFSMAGNAVAAETGGTQEGIKDEKTADSVVEINYSSFDEEPSQYTITKSGKYVINTLLRGNYGLVIDAPDVILEVGQDCQFEHKERNVSTENGDTLLYPNITVNSGASLTICGEGWITSRATKKECATVLNKGTLTIEGNITLHRDRGSNSGPAIYNMGGTVQVNGGVIQSRYDEAILNRDGGKVTINDGYVISYYTAGIKNETGSLTVNGGTIKSTYKAMGDCAPIVCQYGPNTLTINGGKFEAPYPDALIIDYSNEESTIRITDADIVSTGADAGISIKGDNTKLYISGTSKIGGTKGGIKYNNSSNASTGSEIYLSGSPSIGKTDESGNISGDYSIRLKNANNSLTPVFAYNGDNDNPQYFEGNQDEKISIYTENGTLTSGWVVVGNVRKDIENKFIYMDNTEEFFFSPKDKEGTEGTVDLVLRSNKGTPITTGKIGDISTDTITEAGDYYLPEDLSFGSTIKVDCPDNGIVTIDLNGHTMTNKEKVLVVGSGSGAAGQTVIIKDSKSQGKIQCTGKNSGDYAVYVESGKLIVQGGRIYANINSIHTNGKDAAVEITGGYVTAEGGVYGVDSTSVFCEEGQVSIYGGNVTAKSGGVSGVDPASIVCEKGQVFIYGGNIQSDSVGIKLSGNPDDTGETCSAHISGGTVAGKKYGIYFSSKDVTNEKVYLSGSPDIQCTGNGSEAVQVYMETTGSIGNNGKIYASDGDDTNRSYYQGERIVINSNIWNKKNYDKIVADVSEENISKFKLDNYTYGLASVYRESMSSYDLILGYIIYLTWYDENDKKLTENSFPSEWCTGQAFREQMPEGPVVSGKIFKGWLYRSNKSEPYSTEVWDYTEPLTGTMYFKAYYIDAGELEQEYVQNVINKINQIGEVIADDACKERIDAAREAYDALSDELKERIDADTTKKLTDAERKYNKLTSFQGNGTKDNPYLISGKEDLDKFRDLVNAGDSFLGEYIKLTGDIELSGSETSQWTPIGTYTSDTDNNPFAGIFDGNGHTIKGLYINDNTADNVGLL